MSNTPSVPADFDWVTARLKCSTERMLETLASIAKKGVDVRNGSLEADQARYTFSPYPEVGAFSVGRDTRRTGDIMHFKVNDGGITIARAGDYPEATVRVEVVVNDHGDCTCRVNGQDRAPWQVVKDAIEPFLFSL